jgi:outer membrane protein assembly factor BamD
VCYLLIGCLGILGCSHGYNEDRLLEELADQDKEAIFARGEELYELEEYEDARRYFSFVYDTFPNDPLGHKAALRVADTYAKKTDVVNLTEARLRYKDFVNRYPNDPDRDYALLMLGNTYTARNPRPDRDLDTVHEALDAYRQLVNLYSDSTHMDEAQQQIAKLRGILAEHELQVASFYARNKRWSGAVSRLEYLKENYPEYDKMEQVDLLLSEANEAVEKREAELEELRKKREKSSKR